MFAQNFPHRIIGRKVGTRQIWVSSFSMMQTRLFPSLYYKHVNMLEHLRGNPFAGTQSEQGLWDRWLITLVNWMAIHDSARLGDTSVFAMSYVCLADCATGGFLRWRSQSITAATWAQSSRAVLAAGSTGGLPRQRDWAGVMIAIRQLYEYLWQTSALKNIAWMLHRTAS